MPLLARQTTGAELLRANGIAPEESPRHSRLANQLFFHVETPSVGAIGRDLVGNPLTVVPGDIDQTFARFAKALDISALQATLR